MFYFLYDPFLRNKQSWGFRSFRHLMKFCSSKILRSIFILLHLSHICVKKKYPGGGFFFFLGKRCFILERGTGPNLAPCSPTLPTVFSDFGVPCCLVATKGIRTERVAGSYCHHLFWLFTQICLLLWKLLLFLCWGKLQMRAHSQLSFLNFWHVCKLPHVFNPVILFQHSFVLTVVLKYYW